MTWSKSAAAALLSVLALPAVANEEYVPEHGLEGQPEVRGMLGPWIESVNQRTKDIDLFVEKVKNSSTIGGMPGLTEESGHYLAAGECTRLANCVVYKVERINDQGTTETDDDTVEVRQLSNLEVARLAGVSPGSDFFRDMGMTYVGVQMGLNMASTPDGRTDPGGKMASVRDYLWGTEQEKKRAQEKIDRDRPWEDPNAMIGSGGLIMLDTAMAVEKADRSLREGAETARAEADRRAAAIEQFEPIGEEDFNGVQAMRYDAEGLDILGTSGGSGSGEPTATIHRGSLWIDPERLVSVGHRFEGTLEENGDVREFFIQVKNSDFRNPPGCGELVRPYTRTMELGGMLDDEQMAQMEEAKRQLEEFDHLALLG